jgi:hypothetical protein
MTLPETPRSSKQQYRLTKAGSEVIDRLAIRSDGQD